MKKFIVGAMLALSSMFAVAAPVAAAQEGRMSVVLFNESRTCKEGSLYAEFNDGNKVHKGCWRGVGASLIGIEYEDGDQGMLPVNIFRPVRDS